MVNNMNTLIKGVIIGLGKIIPGVSGSLLAISLGVYEKCIDIISNIRKELKYNIKFLILLLFGILLGIVFGSKLIHFFLNKFYLYTMCLFIGLIVSTVPSIMKKIDIKNNINYLCLLIPIIIIYFMSVLPHNKIYVNSNMIIILLGYIDAITMIIPGVSGTAIFMILGVYDFILSLFGHIFSYQIIPFSLGMIIGVFTTSKIINYFFKNYNANTYQAILSLVIASIFVLIRQTFNTNYNLLNILLGLILIIIGYYIGNFFDKK